MMQTLRYEVLGKERFDYAFRQYLRAWAYKHPTPADFFRLMRDASGMDLDFFWRDWIYTTARLDQAVDSVGTADGALKVFLSNRGTMTLPLEMELTYADGTTERVRLPVEMWNLGIAVRLSGARWPAGDGGGGGSAGGAAGCGSGRTTHSTIVDGCQRCALRGESP